MNPSPRILRREAEDFERPPDLSSRDLDKRNRIRRIGQHLMARHGRNAITLANLALALGHGTAAIRRHFVDMDALLGDLLRRHLIELSRALGKIPHDAPDRQPAMRAAYIAFTRTGYGGHTEAHRLLLRDRHTLPPDELDSIEQTLNGLCHTLGGPHALALLDNPIFTARQIEVTLEALFPAPEPATAAPPRPEAPTLPATFHPAPAAGYCLPPTMRLAAEPRAGPSG